MKIEVGEYGRTNLGNIIKFAWIEYSEGKRDESKVLLINNDILSNDFYYFSIGEKIVKHSKNIIDLIEIGDYVNGHIVIDIDRNEDNELFLITEDYMDFEGTNCIYDKEIKSIVTHEKFASVEYKL